MWQTHQHRRNHGREPIHMMSLYQGFDTDANTTLRKHVKKWVQKHPKNSIIIGDFNEVLSAADSCSININGKTTISQKKKSELHKYLNRIGLADVATHINPDAHEHTHIQQTMNGRNLARLDYIYATHKLKETVPNFTTHKDSNILSDHTPISCTLPPKLKITETTPINRPKLRNISNKKWAEWTAAVGEKNKRHRGPNDRHT